ncbi:MAG TPA: hypothetical protein VFT29_18485 [Gemmatimonadaceae bacterium]|nr:hypothetical protein [Gemmatimonadaceae bacterium]
MYLHPRIGDFVTNTCPQCKKIVRSRLERRSVTLARTRLVVPHVLVDVCVGCGHALSIAPESMAQLREAGVPK